MANVNGPVIAVHIIQNRHIIAIRKADACCPTEPSRIIKANGFPIGGILIHPSIESKYGMLGTTFGGNHLACAAGIAVLDTLEEEKLIDNTNVISKYLISKAQEIPEIKNIKGKGLMIGLEFDFEVGELRKKLIYDYKIFTGGATNKKLLRILPPLTIKKEHVDQFFEALKKALK